MRVTRHLIEVATTAAPAKEIRIFGLIPTLVGRHRSLWREIDDIQDRTARLAGTLSAIGWGILAGLVIGGVGAWLLRRAVRSGQLSPSFRWVILLAPAFDRFLIAQTPAPT